MEGRLLIVGEVGQLRLRILLNYCHCLIWISLQIFLCCLFALIERVPFLVCLAHFTFITTTGQLEWQSLQTRGHIINVHIHQYIDYLSMSTQEEEITLVFNKFCPFAQRALLVSIEKQLPARFQKASLKEKEPFFKELYAKAMGRDPTNDGKVPILIHNGNILTESEAVCWYMCESFTSGTPLIPACPLKKFKMRLMIKDQVDGMIALLYRGKQGQFRSKEGFKQEVNNFLTRFEGVMEGPYMLGDVSLVDMLIYPWFERWVIFEHYFGVPLDAKFKKIHSWLDAMSDRPSVQQTKGMTTDDYYISRSKKLITPRL